MRIGDGARGHGIADEDMLHASRNAISQSSEEEGFTMLRLLPAWALRTQQRTDS